MTPQLREYQQWMADAVMQRNVLLAPPPGLGKTLVVLHAVDRLLFDTLEIDRVLVVGPKIVVGETWPNELEKWGFDRLRYRVWDAETFDFEVAERRFRGEVVGRKLRQRDPDAFRRRVLEAREPLHFVSRDNFYAFALAIGKDWPFDMIVIDESYAFSDGDSNRYKILQAVLPYTKRVVLLNGTPVGNGYEKLFWQMKLVGADILDPTLTQFRMRWMDPDKVNPRQGKVFSWKPRPGAFEHIVASCEGALLTLRETDWLTLPERIDIDVPVTIPRADYEEMERVSLLELPEDQEAVAVNSGVLYNKLAQLAGGVVFDTEKGWHETHTAKLEALQEITEQHPGPLLIWTQFRPDVERIQKLLPGALHAPKVKNLERRWNAGEIRYLIAHPDSLGFGANLQDCPGAGMVWFAITANAAHTLQAVKRIWRSGRKEPVRNYRIYARDTVESDVMLGRLEERVGWHNQLIEAMRYRR